MYETENVDNLESTKKKIALKKIFLSFSYWPFDTIRKLVFVASSRTIRKDISMVSIKQTHMSHVGKLIRSQLWLLNLRTEKQEIEWRVNYDFAAFRRRQAKSIDLANYRRHFPPVQITDSRSSYVDSAWIQCVACRVQTLQRRETIGKQRPNIQVSVVNRDVPWKEQTRGAEGWLPCEGEEIGRRKLARITRGSAERRVARFPGRRAAHDLVCRRTNLPADQLFKRIGSLPGSPRCAS